MTQRRDSMRTTASNVTPLSQYLTKRAPIRHDGTRRLFRLWESLRGERSAPDKEELPLGEMGALLPWVGLSEPEERPNGAHVWRLVGSGLSALLGAGLEGRRLFSGWDRFERSTLRRMVRNVTEHGQPFVAQLVLADETTELAVELSAFPLRDGLGDRRLALLLMLPLSNENVLFGPARSARLTGLRTIWTTPVPGADGSFSAALVARHGYAPFTVIPGGLDERER